MAQSRPAEFQTRIAKLTVLYLMALDAEEKIKTDEIINLALTRDPSSTLALDLYSQPENQTPSIQLFLTAFNKRVSTVVRAGIPHRFSKANFQIYSSLSDELKGVSEKHLAVIQDAFNSHLPIADALDYFDECAASHEQLIRKFNLPQPSIQLFEYKFKIKSRFDKDNNPLEEKKRDRQEPHALTKVVNDYKKYFDEDIERLPQSIQENLKKIEGHIVEIGKEIDKLRIALSIAISDDAKLDSARDVIEAKREELYRELESLTTPPFTREYTYEFEEINRVIKAAQHHYIPLSEKIDDDHLATLKKVESITENTFETEQRAFKELCDTFEIESFLRSDKFTTRIQDAYNNVEKNTKFRGKNNARWEILAKEIKSLLESWKKEASLRLYSLRAKKDEILEKKNTYNNQINAIYRPLRATLLSEINLLSQSAVDLSANKKLCEDRLKDTLTEQSKNPKIAGLKLQLERIQTALHSEFSRECIADKIAKNKKNKHPSERNAIYSNYLAEKEKSSFYVCLGFGFILALLSAALFLSGPMGWVLASTALVYKIIGAIVGTVSAAQFVEAYNKNKDYQNQIAHIQQNNIIQPQPRPKKAPQAKMIMLPSIQKRLAESQHLALRTPEHGVDGVLCYRFHLNNGFSRLFIAPDGNITLSKIIDGKKPQTSHIQEKDLNQTVEELIKEAPTLRN